MLAASRQSLLSSRSRVLVRPTFPSSNKLIDNVPLSPSITRRHYLFLPTSWTELRYRMQQVKQSRILNVKTLNWRLYARDRYRASLARYQQILRNSIVGRKYFDVKQTYRNSATRAWFLRQKEKRKTRAALLRARWKQFWKTRQVTLSEYSEESWFDDYGRPLTSRDPTGRFVNPWLAQSTGGVKSLLEILKWRWERLQRVWKEQGWAMMLPQLPALVPNNKVQASPPTPLDVNYPGEKLKVTWIGHSTCLLQQQGLNILTDPMFSHRASPFPNTPVGVGREIPPAFTVDQLPPQIDVCLISHDHYDHLDKASVLQLKSRVQVWVVPLGIGEWLQSKCDIARDAVVELEWWESIQLQREQSCRWKILQRHVPRADRANPALLDPPLSPDTVWITACPAQHWSSRTFWDRNRRLWCSFGIFLPHTTVYFAGDTAFPVSFPLFPQIRDYLGPLELALLPIGAYAPDFFMHDAHMNPPEALRVHRALGAQRSLGIHWGTFCLSEEPLHEPAEWLRSVKSKEDDFVTVEVGDCFLVEPRHS